MNLRRSGANNNGAKRIFLGLLILSMLSLSVFVNCSLRRTRQFLVPEEASGGSLTREVQVGEWTIRPPVLTAYRGVIDMSSVANENMFWITIRADHPEQKNGETLADLRIDSVKVTFLPDGETFWRASSRSLEYSATGKAFDFFKESGVEIPLEVSKVAVSFDAVLATDSNPNGSSTPVQFELHRSERAVKVPLLQE